MIDIIVIIMIIISIIIVIMIINMLIINISNINFIHGCIIIGVNHIYNGRAILIITYFFDTKDGASIDDSHVAYVDD